MVSRSQSQYPAKQPLVGGERVAISSGVDGSLTSRLRRGSHAGSCAVPLVGEVPQQPPGFQPRADLMAALEPPGPQAGVIVVQPAAGMCGVGRSIWQRPTPGHGWAKDGSSWRGSMHKNIGDVLGGMAEVSRALGLITTGDERTAGLAVRRWLEAGGDQCLHGRR